MAIFYIVATPIGHLADMSFRAVEVLKQVDLIACEDTRVSQRLLEHYDIRTSCTSYHDHSSEKDRASILRKLDDGKSIALISDAGMPLISDPGYKLVERIKASGHQVTCVPGASAVTTALVLSGLPSHSFMFDGFLPQKQQARSARLSELAHYDASIIFYESPRRLLDSLADIREVLGERDVSVARELTKQFEEVQTGPVSEIIDHFTQTPPRGEIVLILGPRKEGELDIKAVDAALKKALENYRIKDAVDIVHGIYGMSKKDLYRRALHL